MLQQVDGSWKNTNSCEELAKLAIEAAVSLNWQTAAKINQKIISSTKDDAQALNRLAHAQVCLGELTKAKKTYQKVLAIDPYNIIARKNLEKITKSNGQTNGHINGKSIPTNGNLTNAFIFEPGKTKIISLLNLAPPAIVASLNCGDQILLNPKKHSVSITTMDGIYLGALPDDLAHRLINFIESGNKYDTFVKYATTKNLTIFIRETQRSEKFANQPSFSDSKSYFDGKSFEN